MHRSGTKRYPGYEVEQRGQFAGYRNAIAGWPLSSDLIPRQDNPDNLISTTSTLFADLIPSITGAAWNLRLWKPGLYRAHSKFPESIAYFARRLVPRWSIQLFPNYLRVGNVCLWFCYLLHSNLMIWSNCALLCFYSGWPNYFNTYHRKLLCILRAWC